MRVGLALAIAIVTGPGCALVDALTGDDDDDGPADAGGRPDSGLDAGLDAAVDGGPDGGPDGGEPPDAGDPCAAVQCPPDQTCMDGACTTTAECDPACGDGFVCSGGSCINELADEDGDGYVAAQDCDDADPEVYAGTTTACSTACGEGTTTCEVGVWQPCTAPTDCRCTPGQENVESCGNCGTATRSCTAQGVWGELGACTDRGVCSAGATQNLPCKEPCSRQTRICQQDCTWGEFGGCALVGECGSGTTEFDPCGNCGMRSHTCVDCFFQGWTDCGEEGECARGSTESRACGNCGSETRACDETCRWEDWGACGEGECAPEETRTQSCGNCGTQSATCGGDCIWGAWGACTGEGCHPGDEQSQLCCGESVGTAESRTCAASCEWGPWSGCDECGNGTCHCSESPETCPTDCYCVLDGVCDHAVHGEDCTNCNWDCDCPDNCNARCQAADCCVGCTSPLCNRTACSPAGAEEC